jgi:GFO/IDH/MocA C-terminal domain
MKDIGVAFLGFGRMGETDLRNLSGLSRVKVDLDLARFLVGEVEEVQAWGTVLVDERFAKANDADTAVTLLRFVNGALGVVETSRHSNWGYDIRTEVAGAAGSAGNSPPGIGGCQKLAGKPPREDLGDTSMKWDGNPLEMPVRTG